MQLSPRSGQAGQTIEPAVTMRAHSTLGDFVDLFSGHSGDFQGLLPVVSRFHTQFSVLCADIWSILALPVPGYPPPRASRRTRRRSAFPHRRNARRGGDFAKNIRAKGLTIPPRPCYNLSVACEAQPPLPGCGAVW